MNGYILDFYHFYFINSPTSVKFDQQFVTSMNKSITVVKKNVGKLTSFEIKKIISIKQGEIMNF